MNGRDDSKTTLVLSVDGDCCDGDAGDDADDNDDRERDHNHDCNDGVKCGDVAGLRQHRLNSGGGGGGGGGGAGEALDAATLASY